MKTSVLKGWEEDLCPMRITNNINTIVILENFTIKVIFPFSLD
jgi:hypothetical protein